MIRCGDMVSIESKMTLGLQAESDGVFMMLECTRRATLETSESCLRRLICKSSHLD